MKARAPGLSAAGLLSLALAACAGDARPRGGGGVAVAPACQAPARPMTRLELLFGTSRPGRPPVSEAEWADFLAAEVTPRFPAGLTVLSGHGQWQAGDGTLAGEASKILVVWHEPTGRAEAEIEAIRDAYRRRFGQESVMRVESVSCVSF